MKISFQALFSMLVVAAVIGWVAGFIIVPRHPKLVVRPIVQNVIKRNYDEMSMLEMQRALMCYDTSPFKSVYSLRESQTATTVTLGVTLCDRHMSQDILVPVASSQNWKLYVGIGVGAAATAGLVYLAAQVIK